jgi:hypothetical protein
MEFDGTEYTPITKTESEKFEWHNADVDTPEIIPGKLWSKPVVTISNFGYAHIISYLSTGIWQIPNPGYRFKGEKVKRWINLPSEMTEWQKE